MTQRAQSILAGTAAGPVIATTEALSFWGGIDPATGCIIDVHHPLHGRCVTGSILMMPTTRGSCTGSGVLLDLALTGRAPAALVLFMMEQPKMVSPRPPLGVLLYAGASTCTKSW